MKKHTLRIAGIVLAICMLFSACVFAAPKEEVVADTVDFTVGDYSTTLVKDTSCNVTDKVIGEGQGIIAVRQSNNLYVFSDMEEPQQEAFRTLAREMYNKPTAENAQFFPLSAILNTLWESGNGETIKYSGGTLEFSHESDWSMMCYGPALSKAEPDPVYYTVTVNYLNQEEDNTALQDAFVQGNIEAGKPYDVTEKKLSEITVGEGDDAVVYEYKKADGDALSMEAIDGNKVINLYYAKKTVEEPADPVYFTVTFHYVENETEKVLNDPLAVCTVPAGDSYDVSTSAKIFPSLTFEGDTYEYSEENTNTALFTGEDIADDVDIFLVYVKKAAEPPVVKAKYSVTVNYLIKGTATQLKESVVKADIEEGTAYDVSSDVTTDSITKDGRIYLYDSVTGDPLSSEAIDGNKVIDVLYTRYIPSTGGDPKPPKDEPKEEDEPVLIDDEDTPLAGGDLDEILEDDVPLADAPETGDTMVTYFAMMAVALGALFLSLKKREN